MVDLDLAEMTYSLEGLRVPNDDAPVMVSVRTAWLLTDTSHSEMYSVKVRVLGQRRVPQDEIPRK